MEKKHNYSLRMISEGFDLQLWEMNEKFDVQLVSMGNIFEARLSEIEARKGAF
jgi:hypothetical protein